MCKAQGFIERSETLRRFAEEESSQKLKEELYRLSEEYLELAKRKAEPGK